ncbi:hypothetical protein EXE10_18215 [Acinetobacter sp. WCHAc060033]|uniref:Rho termination factor N-terminal domain-containing protein n=1 Tax=Acinetobacter sp. WCHAc060033 TaxID=2518624 RepID=UPI001022CB8D|nr:Rho termination factor N-terminal domain-containing protein [Acinetobacter sp. WCHAc060033]RZG78355.1 hypothetical protein EXE10_18215 [Acinetobacter sp. WCHAc060033]
MKKTVLIALTSAVVIGGEIRKKGDEFEVSHELAQDLLRRGRGTMVEGGEDDEHEIDLAKLKKPQLIELAIEYGVENPESLTVAQLIEKITEVNEALEA